MFSESKSRKFGLKNNQFNDKRRFQRYSTVLLKSIENDSPIGQPHRKFSGAYPAQTKKGVRQFTSNMHFKKERRKKMPRKRNSLKHDIFIAATKML